MSSSEPIQAQREQKAEDAKRDQQAEIDELLWLMSDKRGRRWMWRRLSECGIYRISYTGGDFAATAFAEGRRTVGLNLIVQLMQHCPDRFNEMQKEAKQNERRPSK